MKIFIYGTLRKSQSNHDILEQTHAIFLGKSITFNTHKSDLDSGMYPELYNITTEGYKIQGEVYEIPEENIYILDEFEGAPDLYYRDKIQVNLNNKIIECYTYFKTL